MRCILQPEDVWHHQAGQVGAGLLVHCPHKLVKVVLPAHSGAGGGKESSDVAQRFQTMVQSNSFSHSFMHMYTLTIGMHVHMCMHT